MGLGAGTLASAIKRYAECVREEFLKVLALGEPVLWAGLKSVVDDALQGGLVDVLVIGGRDVEYLMRRVKPVSASKSVSSHQALSIIVKEQRAFPQGAFYITTPDIHVLGKLGFAVNTSRDLNELRKLGSRKRRAVAVFGSCPSNFLSIMKPFDVVIWVTDQMGDRPKDELSAKAYFKIVGSVAIYLPLFVYGVLEELA